MTKDEALKLSMEAMEITGGFDVEINAIKEALAQPEPWEKFCDSNCVWTDHHPDCKLAEQEPVAFVKGCNRGQWEIFPAKAYQIFEREQPLYTTPPQRKPLTDEEIYDMYNEPRSDAEMIAFARAIEAAHGIKGEA